MREYVIINFLIFFVALFINFRIRERGSVNMLDDFDAYRKKQYNAADYIKNYYNENDYQRDPSRGKHTSQSHEYVDIFANPGKKTRPQPPAKRQDAAGRLINQVTKGNPALEKAFRELQQEFQKNRSK